MKVIMDSLHVFAGGSTKGWTQYRKDLLMKYAPRVLPVLQEVSGTDGAPLSISFDTAFNAPTRKAKRDSKQ